MNKQLLIKFFNGTATEKEIDQIIEWVDKNEANRKYFAELKSIYDTSTFEDKNIKKDYNRRNISPLYNL